MTVSVPRQAWFAVLATIAVLLPFVGKAFHVDDPLFIWMADQISRDPQDPYGFGVNWYSTIRPGFLVMENPPLSSYYAALVGRFLGWSEPAMHLGFFLPAIASILGTFFLARRLSDSPLLAALLTLFTPVFLVSATTVMCDVWLLALWMWSITCWLLALERNAWWLYLISSVLAAAAALTKYFGLSLVPLLLVFTLVRDRRFTFRLLILLIPLFVIAWLEVITRAKYEHGIFSNAVLYPWTQSPRPERHFFKPLLTGLSFTGGCLLSGLFFLPMFKRRTLLFAGAILFAVFLPLFYLAFASGFSSESIIIALLTQGALFSATGIGILALAVADWFQRKTADSVLLFLWIIGTFCFASFLNWSITSRTLLPIAPAVAILLVRRLSAFGSGETRSILQWWALLPAAILSLSVTYADYKFANTGRSASQRFRDQFRTERGTVWFEGHWGFQYYMQQWKAKPVDLRDLEFVPGDILILPVNNTNVFHVPGLNFDVLEHVNYPQPWLTVMNLTAGAGFYSSFFGPLPWAFANVPPERYDVLRIRSK
jgi:4-amino-4-deoxy-L-arabinose transferase-like glycosyltransferase